jgi:uncharacterized protein (DUF934 family)
MDRIIRDGQIVDDHWCMLAADADMVAFAASDRRQFLLPMVRWADCREILEQGGHQVGVWLAADDSPEALIPDMGRIPLVAIHFPCFTDGRGYSLARLLRQRYGFCGELRAFGDILRDQIYFLHQCGFNAFGLRADQSVDEAIVALRDYSWSPLVGH